MCISWSQNRHYEWIFYLQRKDFRAQIEKVIGKKMPQKLSIPLDLNPAYRSLLGSDRNLQSRG